MKYAVKASHTGNQRNEIYDRFAECSFPDREKLSFGLTLSDKKDEIEAVLNDTDAVVGLLKENTRENILNLLYNKIMQLRDISGTIRRLESGIVLNDIEFFEIKHFAILSEYVRETVFNIGLSCIQIPDLKEVIQMLDPENKRIPHFYIYNRYSVLLTYIVPV